MKPTSSTPSLSRFWIRQSVWWTAAILLAGALGVYFRLYPLTVFPRDLSQNTAKFMVLAKMRQAAAREFERTGAGLPSNKKTRYTEAFIAQEIRKEPKKFKHVLNDTAKIVERETRVMTRGGFLLEVDPYYYMSQTERILKTGRLADRTRGREFLNPMTLAPTGYWYPMDLHPYVGAFLYTAATAVRPGIDLMAVLRWVPLMLAMAVLAVFAWYCRRVAGITGWAGFLGLVYVMLCPMFLKRSLVGWYDTDPYNVLFPLVALTGIFMAFGPAASARNRWIGACVAGAGFALHALFWRGWLIPFLVIFLFLLVGWLLCKWVRAAGLTPRLYAALLLPILLTPWIAVACVWGPLGVRQEIASAAEFIRGFLKPDFSPWPDVFITVGELGSMNFWRLTELLGGFVWISAVLIGLVMRLVRQIRSGKPQIIPLIVLLGISCVGLIVSVRIQRFAILAAAPLAAAVPFAWAEWRERCLSALPMIFAPQAVRAITRRFGIIWAAATLVAVSFLAVRANAEIVRFYPLYNPAWDRMMSQIREKTPDDGIITSWWSPGHFLTSMGKRRVTFDGSSQNEPQAYWVANLFIENSERNSLGILRMLNASGNASVDYLSERGFSLDESVGLIKAILPLSRQNARDRLLRRFGATDADGLLDLTHGSPDASAPPSYLFVYNHMIQQALALEFIGRWNFKKAEAFEAYVKQQPKELDRHLLARATPQNTGLLWSMTERPTFYESEGYEIGRDGPTVIFSNGAHVNLQTHEATILKNSQVNGRPASVFWINTDGEWVETPVTQSTLTVSILLIDDAPQKVGGPVSYRSVIMGRRFAGSLAMRLYYFGGRGLEFIRRIAMEDSAAQRTRLALFEVDWAAFSSSLAE